MKIHSCAKGKAFSSFSAMICSTCMRKAHQHHTFVNHQKPGTMNLLVEAQIQMDKSPIPEQRLVFWISTEHTTNRAFPAKHTSMRFHMRFAIGQYILVYWSHWSHAGMFL